MTGWALSSDKTAPAMQLDLYTHYTCKAGKNNDDTWKRQHRGRIRIELLEKSLTMFRNFMTERFFLSFIFGRSFIWLCVTSLTDVFILDSSARAMGSVVTVGTSLPKLDKIMQSLDMASSNFEAAASCLTSRVDAVMLSSKHCTCVRSHQGSLTLLPYLVHESDWCWQLW